MRGRGKEVEEEEEEETIQRMDTNTIGQLTNDSTLHIAIWAQHCFSCWIWRPLSLRPIPQDSSPPFSLSLRSTWLRGRRPRLLLGYLPSCPRQRHWPRG